MSMCAMLAAVEHEIRQPLGAMVANANAGRRWLGRSPPELDEARAAFDAIAADGHRSSDVVHSVRAMFDRNEDEGSTLDANELIQETIALVREELQSQRIAVDLELSPRLPRVAANRGQLQQVMLNLVANAADAMRTVNDRAAVLHVASKPFNARGVEVTIADSGPGIDPTIRDRIFDAFFTTKSNGMGMGLAICRSIVEAHGGTLSAQAGVPHGAIFQMVLPGGR
jgi:signal transduction histidine kinase